MTAKILLLTTTGGAFLNEALARPAFRSRIEGVVSDRACGGLQAAARHGLPTRIISEPDNGAFSAALLRHAAEARIDYLVTASFRRLLKPPMTDAYRDRLFNVHPSILPAFEGLNPIDQQLAVETRLVGSTVHVVDDSVDGGPIVQQSALVRAYGEEPERLRHRLFELSVKGLLQLVAWLWEGRLAVTPDGVRVTGARFDDPSHAPAFDDPEAAALSLPWPWWDRPEYRHLAPGAPGLVAG
ncbi:phosphoribosylglycinamide formyltransferase-1 [Tistlia consotensis]|uniref:phosphoribosylglycinamide formyltransferase 1 n=1 Tax=Tistlia consotensis USBA 355 TaxID=560819 RepID=A0A1Y6BJG7_9PROT|nr:formyltransferase family protein [Tistlia consotensis]SMF13515.1 phosphoribosylglycinamide formyltransferase-1 [Tistlia consotensis USBA 355]SNR50425.1 phosphoribosylglycinamide formyltransferase-1 [Tistlia consotensis]